MSVQEVSIPATQPPAANGNGSHRLKSLAISRGFLDGIRFELADGLNCLIGGRGTGKTTALELVRYVMDALPGREEYAAERKRIESLVEKNLAGGTVELEVETKDGFCYLVSRAYGEEPLVLTPDRRPIELSVRSGGLFRVDIFSRNAVERLADESNSQLDLLDAFEAEAIAETTAQLAQLRSTLATNAAQIVPLQASIATMKEELNRLPVVEEKLRAYATGDGDDAGEIDRAHGLKVLRDREQRAVTGVAGALSQLRGETARLRGRLAGQPRRAMRRGHRARPVPDAAGARSPPAPASQRQVRGDRRQGTRREARRAAPAECDLGGREGISEQRHRGACQGRDALRAAGRHSKRRPRLSAFGEDRRLERGGGGMFSRVANL